MIKKDPRITSVERGTELDGDALASTYREVEAGQVVSSFGAGSYVFLAIPPPIYHDIVNHWFASAMHCMVSRSNAASLFLH